MALKKNIMKQLFGLILIITIFIIGCNNNRIKFVTDSNYYNQKLKYNLLGYEEENKRFWVVPNSTDILNSQEKLNDIIFDLYNRYSTKYKLDSYDWSVSFFKNKENAHYKNDGVFDTENYLAEYSSINSSDDNKKNKILIFPAIPKKKKWYAGPSFFYISRKGNSIYDDNNKITIRISDDKRKLIAISQDSSELWTVDIIEKCDTPAVGLPEIRHIEFGDKNILNVTFGKHSFATVNILTGVVKYIGSD